MSSKLFYLFLAMASATSIAVALQVPVAIYYESLCPDSRNFFIKQFTPVYQKPALQKYIKADFVPWGHANETNGTIECQHGNEECKGNRLQACALNIIPDDVTKASFVSCIMALNVSTFTPDLCNSTANNYSADISKCYQNETLSNEYLLKYKNQTDLTFGKNKFGVPYVIFNMKKSDEASANATKNFLSTICTHLTSEKLTECHNSASVFTATLIPAAILLMLGRL